MAEFRLQYRFHGRFISQADAARLFNLKHVSSYIGTSLKAGRSHTYIKKYAVPEKAARTLQREVNKRRAERHPAGLPVVPISRPPTAPPKEFEAYEGPSLAPLRYKPPEPVQPVYDYEKQGFESPWDDDVLFDDEGWGDMDWDGDITDLDADFYVDGD